jgi:hypothetical protein
MQIGTLQLLILATAVLASTGCDHSRSLSTNQPSATAPYSPSPQQPMVFYDETGTPSKIAPALSELELTRIIDAVATQTKDRIWLIRVKPPNSVGAYAGAIVYLTPQQQTSRIRTGYAYSTSVHRETVDVGPRWRYVQVSRPDEPSTEQPTLPSASDLPFSQPSVGDSGSGKTWPMSEEEIIAIVDFVRLPSSYENVTPGEISSDHLMARDAQKLPILRIGKDEDTIRVEFGYQHDGLWGHGRAVIVECTPKGYRIVKWGMWMS